MTANPRPGRTPGQPFIDRKGRVWVLRTDSRAERPWARFINDLSVGYRACTQEEAEAAGLSPLYELSEDDLRLLKACRDTSTGTLGSRARLVQTVGAPVIVAPAEGPDALLDPNDPDREADVLRLAAAVVEREGIGKPKAVTADALIEKAERLERTAAADDEDTEDRTRAEEFADARGAARHSEEWNVAFVCYLAGLSDARSRAENSSVGLARNPRFSRARGSARPADRVAERCA
ncbi:Uncharacterised protein (plasmid) [Tsukamurella tyrosinosolvens]|uniref:Uncharacterized protein n=1 Tax=Tsukamurella tyrosinosolvens TaxID=57704 RepID=A0A1H4VPF5_TSUTY|nr:hypothetical protein [Tsukamurella tyrosinosolvens]KXO90925.1 hypothetical protein AXK58_21055 [Tsukamurella tyrosinosolvens]SEC82750.1 hypothetical protein SAMN04489793_3290 [Tsukamurella tyrosinosolvens]VEH90393.1 Uncharacterised protein [Tsukamurella tyrosinosolvens]